MCLADDEDLYWDCDSDSECTKDECKDNDKDEDNDSSGNEDNDEDKDSSKNEDKNKKRGKESSLDKIKRHWNDIQTDRMRDKYLLALSRRRGQFSNKNNRIDNFDKAAQQTVTREKDKFNKTKMTKINSVLSQNNKTMSHFTRMIMAVAQREKMNATKWP